MRHPAPVIALYKQLWNSRRRALADLHREQASNAVLSRKLRGALDDIALLLCMARDRETAEAFLSTRHDFDGLTQEAER